MRSGRLAGIVGFVLHAILCGGMVFAAQTAAAASAPIQVAEQHASGNKVEAGKILFEKVIEAHGGRKRLSSIRETIFRADYKIYPQGTDVTAVYYTKLPDRFRIDMMFLGGMPDIRAFDGKWGWRNDRRTGAVAEMTQPVLEEFKNSVSAAQGMLNPEMLNITPSLEGRAPIDGKDYIVLSYSNWGGFDMVYALIDPETFLPRKFISLKPGGRTEVVNSDYREVEGLKLPFSFNLNIDGRTLMSMSIKEWKFNPGLEDAFFEKAAVAVGSAWGVADLNHLSATTSQPKLIRMVQPIYPDLAKRARVSGNVKVRITIGEEGAVRDPAIIEGHPLLDDAALRAVQQWKYTPAMQEGKPVAVTTIVTLTFRTY